MYLAEKDSFGFVFPFDPELVAHLKEIPGREYAKKPAPHWLVPCTPLAAPQAIEFAVKYGFDFTDDIIARIGALPVAEKEYQANVAASSAKESDIDISTLAGELRPFQKAAVSYALLNPKCIIGDDMGLGKTIEALAIIEAANAYPALIVCPASVKGVWQGHALVWLPHRRSEVANGGKFPPCFVDEIVITNYDQLTKWMPFIEQINWKAICFDEFHYLKNSSAKRSKLAAQIAKDCPRILMLSGTPVLNRPIELAHPLEILGALPKFGGFWGFAKRYTNAQEKTVPTKWGRKKVWDFTGADHTAELHEKLQGFGVYIRRTKKEVLKDLPPKQRTLVPIPIDNKEEYTKAEREIARQLRSDSKFVALTRFETLKQLSAAGKMEGAAEWIEDFLESGEKLVFFAHHRIIVEEIAKRFNAPMIRGDTPLDARDEAVWRFQSEPAVKLIVCNIQAGGVGITLTAASNVAFLELPWSFAHIEQAEDRTHRIGQKNSVNSYFLIDQSTIDGEIYDLLIKKVRVTDSVIDGDAEENGDSLVNQIIERIIQRYKEEK